MFFTGNNLFYIKVCLTVSTMSNHMDHHLTLLLEAILIAIFLDYFLENRIPEYN